MTLVEYDIAVELAQLNIDRGCTLGYHRGGVGRLFLITDCGTVCGAAASLEELRAWVRGFSAAHRNQAMNAAVERFLDRTLAP